MVYQKILIGDILYMVSEESLNSLFTGIVLSKDSNGRIRVHASYLPVDYIVEVSMDKLIDIINDSKHEQFVNLLIGHGAMASDILNCFTKKN